MGFIFDMVKGRLISSSVQVNISFLAPSNSTISALFHDLNPSTNQCIIIIDNVRENQEAQDEFTINNTSVKHSHPVSKSSEGQSVLKRLQSELMSLMMSGDPGITAFPEGDSIFHWKGTIIGSKETTYEGMTYKLSLSFSDDYPFKAPIVKFDTSCFHPNVDVFGNICLDILQDKLSSAYDVRTILLSVQSLLGEPNNDSPLNAQAAAGSRRV